MFGKTCSGLLKTAFLKTCKESKCFTHQTHYEVLELSRQCTTRDVKEAFIKLSKKYHPDKNTESSSQKRFVRILEAYNVLSKPQLRCNYDRQLTHTSYRYTTDIPEPAARRRRRFSYDDNTFWSYQNHSQDKYATGRRYYGVPGIQRVSNGIIAVICVLLSALSLTLQLYAVRHLLTLRQEAMAQRSADNTIILAQLHADALKNGNELQIELMEKRLLNNKYS